MRVVFLALLQALCVLDGSVQSELIVSPEKAHIVGPLDSIQLVVTESGGEGEVQRDATRSAEYRIDNPRIVGVEPDGRLKARQNGSTTLHVRANGVEQQVTVEVTNFTEPRPLSFSTDVVPVLTKAGCNSGGCHGKAEGQAGLKLSVFGFDPVSDFEVLAKQNQGRRVNRMNPDASLILRKAVASIPHGGGERMKSTSNQYKVIRQWLTEGATFGTQPNDVESIIVYPAAALLSPGAEQQLRVVAQFTDGRTRDVTATAEFQSHADNIASVTADGRVRSEGIPGEATILVRFLDKLANSHISLPRPGTRFLRPPENNFIDRIVWDKLQRLGIQPSELTDDATFLRRVFLDTIGTLPDIAETRAFLTDKDPKKRSRLIAALLERDEFVLFQSLRWADLLRIDSNAIGPASSVAFTRWLRKQFQQNRPYDEFATEILTATGNTQAQSPAALYLTLNEPTELGSSVSQLFLGVRIECAECHHHPFEKWSQADFYAFAGLFTDVGRKKLPGGATALVQKIGSNLKHPRTSETVAAKGLGEVRADEASEPVNRRAHLVNWLTAPQNPFFARAGANRIWSYYFQRGLVEPVDDLRDSNPASNEELLSALSTFLIKNDFDTKALTRIILESRTYQLSSTPNKTNEQDEQNFSRAAWRPLPAEVLLDAISHTTGVPEKFNGWPIGARALEVWDNRMPSYFFRIFGRPTRTTVCACERGDSPSISQALHLLNSPEISQKITHRNGTARTLANSDLHVEEIIDELYLRTLARFPSASERKLMHQSFESVDRRSATEDLLWTLLNTKEFLFNH